MQLDEITSATLALAAIYGQMKVTGLISATETLPEEQRDMAFGYASCELIGALEDIVRAVKARHGEPALERIMHVLAIARLRPVMDEEDTAFPFVGFTGFPHQAPEIT